MTLKSGRFNLLSLNPDNEIGASGNIDVVSGRTLTDFDVDFTEAFEPDDLLILTIVSGAGAGLVQQISTSSAHTLETVDDISSIIAPGDEFEVRRMHQIGEFFGGYPRFLMYGTSTTADLIWLPDGKGGYSHVSSGLQVVSWNRLAPSRQGSLGCESNSRAVHRRIFHPAAWQRADINSPLLAMSVPRLPG